jgi:hypothetical protein
MFSKNGREPIQITFNSSYPALVIYSHDQCSLIISVMSHGDCLTLKWLPRKKVTVNVVQFL